MTATDIFADGRHEVPGPDRLAALSDNVVAFALTLLVLQLRVPAAAAVAHANSAADLAGQLRKDLGEVVSYLISFYVIAQFWLVHHWVFRRVKAHHEGLAYWNFAFLFTITAMPFTSDLLGNYGGNPLAVDIFAVNLLLANLATQAMLVAGRRGNVLAEGHGEGEERSARVRVAVIVFAIAASVGLAWVSTGAAKLCWLLIVVAPLVAKHRPTGGGLMR